MAMDRLLVEGILRAYILTGGPDGKLNDEGKKFLAIILDDFLPERHGPAFEPIKRAAGSVVAVEAVVIREASVETGSQVLLGWRVHPVFGEGWHTFGTYPKSAQGESFEDAVRRAARDEAGVEVEVIKRVGVKDHKDNPRFPDAPILYLCHVRGGEVKNLKPDGEPKNGDCRWFYKCPPDMLPVQEDYRLDIDAALEMAAVPTHIRAREP